MLDLINACTSASDLSSVRKFLNDFIFDSYLYDFLQKCFTCDLNNEV